MPKSTQARVFVAVHSIALVTELVAEISLYNLIPQENTTIKTRFWAQYIIGVACAVLIGIAGANVIDCLARSGWNLLAWILVILPSIPFILCGFTLHGVDTVLGMAAGSNCISLLKTAYANKKTGAHLNKTQ